MVLGNVPKLHGLVGFGLLAAAFVAPSSCSSDSFGGCEETGTCESKSGSGGEAGAGAEAGNGTGATDTGGSSSSGRGGSSGSSGSTGTDGGEGGDATGGRSGSTGGGGEGGEGDDNGGEGGTGGIEPPPDTTPPTIVSVSPANGEMSVRATANIVITFSEPMDRVATQAAYQSADIPAGALTFAWNSSSTVLTIDPNSDLAYAEGADPNVQARTFTASVTDTAKDLAGNPLVDNFVWSFRTLRRIVQTFTTGSMIRVGASTGPACTVTTYGVVGDFADNSGRFLVITRDISALPPSILEWEAATLSLEQRGVSHNGVFDSLGGVHVFHDAVSPPEAITWNTIRLHDLGDLPTDVTPGPRSVNALVALRDDYEHRVERNQLSEYRLMFGAVNNQDGIADQVYIYCTPAPVLTARYLLP